MAPIFSRRRFLTTTAAAGTFLAAGRGPVARATTTGDQLQPPRAADLRDDGELQRRWLSMPQSRIVLNPYDFNGTLTPLRYNAGPEMPLHVGYYAADTAFNLRSVFGVYQRIADGSGQVVVPFQDDFTTLDPAWTGDAWVSRAIAGGALELTVEPGGTPWGVTYQWVTVDLDQAPFAEITVARAVGSWSLKVNDGTQAVDVVLQGDNAQTGTFSCDIRAATGWTGTKRFQLRIFAIGVGQPVDVDSIRIFGETPVLAGAASSSDAWQPHELDFSGDYADGAHARATDFLYDESTIVRIIDTSGDTTPSRWVFAGSSAGTAAWNASQPALTITADDYVYTIVASATVQSIAYFASQADLLAWLNPQQQPVSGGFWAMEVTLPSTSVVAVGFATTAEGPARAAERARDALPAERAAAALGQRENEWDQRLRQVPRPADFTIAAVSDDGVTPGQVRHSYYAAWVFAIANSLPPMPEAGYAYPQLPAGKPSLWVYGAAGAKASAAWESFLGQQFLAYVDPDLAWRCYEGMLSLVGTDGALNGESLPSRKAQTAMVLYQLTGNSHRLAGVYPALKRLLGWEAQHLYWIPPGASGDPDSRDAEFVVSLIVDLAYARDVAAILGENDDSEAFDVQRTALFQDYLQWFWAPPQSSPAQYYSLSTSARNAGNTIWVTTGLHLDLLQAGDYLDSLEQRFRADFDPTKPFCGFTLPKYPDVSYTTYGLIERGLLPEATAVIDAAIRDVTRANMFAEQYLLNDPPAGDGVRPSLFGDCMMIDLVWVKNGYRMDAGGPEFVRMLDASGGVGNLTIRGKTLNVRLDPSADAVQLSGSLVSDSPACRTLYAPLGQTVSLNAGCAE